MSESPNVHDLRQDELRALLLLASRSIFSYECAKETADSITLLRPSYAAVLDFKSRCETAVKAGIETLDAVDRLLHEIKSNFPASVYSAMFSIRDLLATLEVESRSYASSLQGMMRELDEIRYAASVNELKLIAAIPTHIAPESHLAARLLQLTTDVWVILSQHIAFLNEHVATLCVKDQRFESTSAPVRTGLVFYEKKIASACDSLRNVYELVGVHGPAE